MKRATKERPVFLSRRKFLWKSGGGFGGLALSYLLGRDQALASSPLATGAGGLGYLRFKPKAKRVVQLFMAGAASHVDTFDYKPELFKRNGEKWDPGERVELFQSSPGKTFAPPWAFQPYGQCGKHLSEIVAPLGECVDQMAFIHNLAGKTGVHSQATYLQSTGFQLPGFPGMGAWVSYALGSLNDDLPTFVVLPDHRGFASNGPKNWSAAFLPAEHQGTTIFPGRENPIADLYPTDGDYITDESDAAGFTLLKRLNEKHHASNRIDDGRLGARIRSYELAAKMQLSAPEALDISQEPECIIRMYGLDHGKQTFDPQINPIEETDYFSRKCLVARRLLERGVRFVQVWSGNDNGFPRRNWDSHEDIKRDHGPLALGMATGASALIQDLAQRGMLEDTLVLWATEFGRMPCAQGSKGRDHNPFCFSNWLCGGGIKGGVTVGESDFWGFQPADRNNPTQVYDIHATILYLMGIDHERLTYRHNGIDRRLTDVHGHVIRDLIA
ncbi:MAG: hypothetical protein M2R45_02453 [Verrucomicrobia subdivision 3 bacterium]|nr:hypothetical protein [Limisphaerales bacterium]MCS1413242.1 hypothetical protein [Limisphaerales bacterium]